MLIKRLDVIICTRRTNQDPPGFAWVIHVVDGGRDEARGLVQRIEQRLDTRLLQKVGCRLKHVSRVSRIVVRIAGMVVCFDQ